MRVILVCILAATVTTAMGLNPAIADFPCPAECKCTDASVSSASSDSPTVSTTFLMDVVCEFKQLTKVPRITTDLGLAFFDLRDNNIKRIEAEDFAGIKGGIKYLRLEDNPIEFIAPTALETSKDTLFSCHLSGHRLEFNTSNFQFLRGLTYISTLKIDSLQTSDPTLQRHLQDNVFPEMTHELNDLSITRSSIAVVSENAFSSFKAVYNLDLSYNKLSSVPSALKNAKSLYSVKLNGNKISQIKPGTFSSSPKLYDIELEGNNFREGLDPNAFSGINLERLNLGNCKISKIPKNLFNNEPTLKKLDLKRNQITDTSGEFVLLSNLENLDLSYNPLAWPKANMFMGLSSLEQIVLQSTGLTAIPKDFFKGLSKLKSIYLDLNKNLSYIDPAAFSHLPKGLNLVIGVTNIRNLDFLQKSCDIRIQAPNVQIHCDCHVYKVSRSVEGASCKSPASMEGHTVSILTMANMQEGGFNCSHVINAEKICDFYPVVTSSSEIVYLSMLSLLTICILHFLNRY